MDEKGLVNRWGWNDAQFDMILERYDSRVDDRLTLDSRQISRAPKFDRFKRGFHTRGVHGTPGSRRFGF